MENQEILQRYLQELKANVFTVESGLESGNIVIYERAEYILIKLYEELTKE